mgnify:FL=1
MFKDVTYKSPDGAFELPNTYVDLKRIVNLDPTTKTAQCEIGYWQSQEAKDAGKPPISVRTFDFGGEFFDERWEKIEDAFMRLVVEDIVTIPQIVPGEFEDDPESVAKRGLVHETVLVNGKQERIPDANDPTGFRRIPDPSFVPAKRAVREQVFKDAVAVAK